MKAIFKREFKAYFHTPVGFVLIAAYAFFLGLNFSLLFQYGQPLITEIIAGVSTVAAFVTPVLTMRLISDDRRQKVDQVLLTSPVTPFGIVMGKYLAALAVFAIGFAPTIIFEIVFATYCKVNVLAYFYALLGMILLGGALIAIGMFISSLTESPVIAAILTFFTNILIIYTASLSSMTSKAFLAKILNAMALIQAYENFTTAVFAPKDIIYFLSYSAVFIFLTVRSVESRRWA